MSDLLNPSKTTESITSYDRSFAGQYQNPYGGTPYLVFHMQRITVRDSDKSVIADTRIPDAQEVYAPGKVYDMFDPETGEKIPGVTFTTEQLYAMIYSTMRRCLADTAAIAADPDIS